MQQVQILDCTLRDGGYQNDCNFGFENQKKIIRGLIEAGVDIIECGFLTNRVLYHQDVTRFTTPEQVSAVIPSQRSGKLFVLLANFGEYDPNLIPQCNEGTIDGLRIAFHKKDCKAALADCRLLQDKGYKIFVQAMVSLSYSDEEFLNLIAQVNALEPYAFYIVDSFGAMKRNDLIRLFYLVEHNLKSSIRVGFHSHNNMQLAFSNAQALIDLHSTRNLIIDASIYGMGRGAGNLNTELLVEYVNDHAQGSYNIKPLLTIVDEIIGIFYHKNYWGYSLPNYLSASHNAHPNYARYLDDKKTLTVEDINEIFDMMEESKRICFDQEYIEALYIRYMETGRILEEHRVTLEERLKGKTVLLIAPGKSAIQEQDKIVSFAAVNQVVSISVNFDYPGLEPDYIFLSNLRRYRDFPQDKLYKSIITSNIPSDRAYLKTKYYDLLADEDVVRDNAGLMAIRFLITNEVKEIYLAGFDGYSHNMEENYADNQMMMAGRATFWDAMNRGMSHVLQKYGEQVSIKFLTTPKYILGH